MEFNYIICRYIQSLVPVPWEIHGKLQPDTVNWREIIIIHSVITARSSQHRNNHYANPHFDEFEAVSLYSVHV